MEPLNGCGICDNCRDEFYTTCLNYGDIAKEHRHYGFTTNGGYAEYACMYTTCVHQIPADMSFDVATILTTAGTSLYGIRRARGFQGGETVVVAGPGPIGLLSVA